MRKVMIVSSMATALPEIANIDQYDFVGVEKGALLLDNLKKPMKYVIGDFDSLKKDELSNLRETYKVITLPTHKNETDSEFAIKYVSEDYDEIAICGVSGNRLDHFIAVYNLLAYQDIDFTIYDDQNKIYRLEKGDHLIRKTKKYLSLFALDDSYITIENVAYPLYERELSRKDVYTISNEIIGESTILQIHYGKLMIIESDDK